MNPLKVFLVIGALGATGFGVWKLYQHLMGDDELPAPSPGPKPDNKSGGGGGGGSSKKKPPRPPNMTGNPQGYNTTMFPGFPQVHQAFESLGYSVGPDTGKHPRQGGVTQFQKDWNAVSRASKSGKIPSYEYIIGELDEGEKAGKNTLRALEIVTYHQNKASFPPWKTGVVAPARA